MIDPIPPKTTFRSILLMTSHCLSKVLSIPNMVSFVISLLHLSFTSKWPFIPNVNLNQENWLRHSVIPFRSLAPAPYRCSVPMCFPSIWWMTTHVVMMNKHLKHCSIHLIIPCEVMPPYRCSSFSHGATKEKQVCTKKKSMFDQINDGWVCKFWAKLSYILISRWCMYKRTHKRQSACDHHQKMRPPLLGYYTKWDHHQPTTQSLVRHPKGWSATLGQTHDPDSYGRQWWEIFRNWRRSQ